METWIRRETVYKGRIVTVTNGVVRLADGAEAPREVIEHPGAVGIVPFDGEAVLFVRQYRIAVGKLMTEIPAGKLEGDESPETRARIELEEETGHRAGRLVPAGMFHPSVGVFSEAIHLFLAFDLIATAQRLETDERIEVERIPLDEVRRRLAANAFEDAKTIIGLHALLGHLGGASGGKAPAAPAR